MTGPLILPFNGKVPRIHKTAYIAPNATIIGDVVIGEHASVFYNVVLRGDLNRITIGDRTNIQDNCVLHVDADAPCTLGDDVTVGQFRRSRWPRGCQPRCAASCPTSSPPGLFPTRRAMCRPPPARPTPPRR